MTFTIPFHLMSLCLLYHTLISNTNSNSVNLSKSSINGSLFIRQCNNTWRNPPKNNFSTPRTRLYGTRKALGTNIKSLRNRSNTSKVLRDGTVVETGPGTTFTVLLDDSNKKLRCSLAGRLYLKKVRIWNKSRVKVEFDLIYPEMGRIVERVDP